MSERGGAEEESGVMGATTVEELRQAIQRLDAERARLTRALAEAQGHVGVGQSGNGIAPPQPSGDAPRIAVRRCGPDGIVHYWHPSSEAIYGYTPEEAVGRSILDLIVPPEMRDEVQRALHIGIQTGESPLNGELLLMRKDGTRVPVFSSHALIGAPGQEPEFLCFDLDLTAQREMEAALRQSAERYRAIFEATGTAMLMVEEDTTISLANTEAMCITGLPREELEGNSWTQFVTPECMPLMLEYHHQRRRDPDSAPRSYECRLLDRHGMPHDSLITASMVPGTRQSIISFMDITTRKRTEEELCRAYAEMEQRIRQRTADLTSANEALQKSEADLRRAQAIAHVGDWEWDYDTGAISASEETFHILGAHAWEVNADTAFSQVHPEDRERTWEIMTTALQRGVSQNVEFRVLRPDGSERWVRVEAEALRDSQNNPVRLFGIIQDITERKQAEAERERLLQELKEANAAKDQFLAEVSHELRNPLSPIFSGIQLLRRSPLGEREGRALDIIERNANLQARLINDLLDLSRGARGKMKLYRTPVRIDEVVQAAVDAIQAEAEANGLTLRSHLECGLWVFADFDRLQQVVLNLLSNAVKFTPTGGEVCVHTMAMDSQARVVVEDTGIGIDDALMKHLFQMFQQGENQERKRGLGIGLALAKSLIETHGGRVWAESNGPGKGSRFILELPLTAPPDCRPSAE